MIEWDDGELAKSIYYREGQSALIPIILLRILGNPELDSVQRSLFLFAFAECYDLCDLIDPDVEPGKYRDVLAEKVRHATEHQDMAAKIFFCSDLWKIARLATGELSWREYSIFGGLQSAIGRSRYKRISRETIAARAAGFASTKDIPTGYSTLPVHQVTRTLDALEERGIQLRYQAGRRTVFYARWDMKPAEFKKLMIDLQVKKHRRKHLSTEIKDGIRHAMEASCLTKPSEETIQPPLPAETEKADDNRELRYPQKARAEQLKSEKRTESNELAQARIEGFKPISYWVHKLGPQILTDLKSLETVRQGNQCLYRLRQR